VLPVEAQTLVQTDTAGLATAGTISSSSTARNVPVYRAQPEGKTNPPVILVISEIFGVHEHIKDVARRFAKQGYMALAPDLFVRQGDAGKVPNIADLMKDIVGKTPDAQVMADLDAVVAWAKAKGRRYRASWASPVSAGAGASPGCTRRIIRRSRPAWPGTAAWWASRRQFAEDTRSTFAANLKAPVLGLYGAKDTGIPLESVER
jgi:carboxymethylenebutenolidase